MANTVECDIVSAEEEIFSGKVQLLIAAGSEGDLGIMSGHVPLLTALKPGPIRLATEDDEDLFFYLSGGFLEVQPHKIMVLADTVIRASDIDEAAAEASKKMAEQELENSSGKLDYTRAAIQLAEAAAQLRTLQGVRKRHGK